MHRRRRRLLVAVSAVLSLGAVFVAGQRTDWFAPRPRYSSTPSCEQLMSAPAVEASRRATFGRLWDAPYPQFFPYYGNWPLGSRLCTMTGIRGAVLEPDKTLREPTSRSVTVKLNPLESGGPSFFRRGAVWQARREFHCDRLHWDPEPESEPRLGDEALGCLGRDHLDHDLRGWTVLFRDSNLIVSVSSRGWGDVVGNVSVPPTATMMIEQQRDVRCIAEAIAVELRIPVGERHSCGSADQAV